MSDLKTAAQQALEALESCSGVPHWPALQPTITALRAALAQQEQAITPAELSAALGWPGGISTPVLGKAELLKMVANARVEQREQEPVAWIQPDHLQKARQAPFLCRVEPTQRCTDFVPIYTHPPHRKQEPVAWRWKLGSSGWQLEDKRPNTTGHSDATVVPLYTHPPRREWQGLTEEDIWTLAAKHTDTVSGRLHFARAIEQALRSKNNG